MSDEPVTAFPETLENLAEMATELSLNRPALSAKIKPCDLARCRGTCCHDGAYLSAEEARIIRELAETERTEFAEIGIDLPEKTVVYGNWRGVASGPKTATRPAPMREWVSDYPEHFPETNCVFLHPETASCGLQMLAEKRNLPKWYYKPTTCWMHPLSIEKRRRWKTATHSPQRRNRSATISGLRWIRLSDSLRESVRGKRRGRLGGKSSGRGNCQSPLRRTGSESEFEFKSVAQTLLSVSRKNGEAAISIR